MKQLFIWINVGLASVYKWLGSFLGGFDGILYALVVVVVIDYITRFMSGVVKKELHKDFWIHEIYKNVLIFTMVAIGNIVDKFIISNGENIRMAVILFYLSNKGLSILENAKKVGLDIPTRLIEILSQLLRGGNNKNKDDN